MLVKLNDAKKFKNQLTYYNCNLLKIRIFFKKYVLKFRTFIKNIPMHFLILITIISKLHTLLALDTCL